MLQFLLDLDPPGKMLRIRIPGIIQFVWRKLKQFSKKYREIVFRKCKIHFLIDCSVYCLIHDKSTTVKSTQLFISWELYSLFLWKKEWYMTQLLEYKTSILFYNYTNLLQKNITNVCILPNLQQVLFLRLFFLQVFLFIKLCMDFCRFNFYS